MQHMMGFIA